MKKRYAYLTIDDSPSVHTDDLTDALAVNNIPALLFVRGDFLSENAAPIIRAIQKGFSIGNHNYSHMRASLLSTAHCIDEIERTEQLIEQAYRNAGRPRSGKYFRFPHIDRGAGGFIVDYDAYPAHRNSLLSVFTDGLNITLEPAAEAAIVKKEALQSYLQSEGYSAPFENISLPWFRDTEMAIAADCLYTYSNSDWMLTKRHLGKDWPYKTIDDLKAKIDDDPWLCDRSSHHIILAHDQPEILDVTLATISHMTHKGIEFLPIT